jgi:hypothetical protein
MRKHILIIPLLVMFMILAAGCSGPQVRVVKKHIKASQENDIATAKLYCTGDYLRLMELTEQMMARPGMQAFAQEYNQIIQTVDAKVSYKLIDKYGDKASVKATVLIRDTGQRDSMTFKLTKESGSWLIYDLIIMGVSMSAGVDMLEAMMQGGGIADIEDAMKKALEDVPR